MNRRISVKTPLFVVKSVTVAATLIGAMALYAPSSITASIEGKLNGLDCASHGETCPTDRLDPHVALERDFVHTLPQRDARS